MSKSERKTSQPSFSPTTLFGKTGSVPSLQDTIFQQLLETKGLKGTLDYLKTQEALSGPLKEVFTFKLAPMLSQAVIDDDIATVKAILDFDPGLLISEPKNLGVTEIESKLTWQKFKTEKIFIMAQKLKRLEMIETLLPYFECVENGHKELREQWILPSLLHNEEQDQALQKEYKEKCLRPLINAIKNGLEEDSKDGEEKIDQVLDEFAKKLLPDEATDIDAYILSNIKTDNGRLDIAQLLHAAYEMLYENFDHEFEEKNLNHIYAYYVLAVIQSVISPDLAKVYCTGFYDFYRDKKPLSTELKLADGQPFYRESNSEDFSLHRTKHRLEPTLEPRFLKQFHEDKTKKFRELIKSVNKKLKGMEPPKSSQCVVS